MARGEPRGHLRVLRLHVAPDAGRDVAQQNDGWVVASSTIAVLLTRARARKNDRAEQRAPRFAVGSASASANFASPTIGRESPLESKKKTWPVKINHRRPSRRQASLPSLPSPLLAARSDLRPHPSPPRRRIRGLTARRKDQNLLAKKTRLALSQRSRQAEPSCRRGLPPRELRRTTGHR